MQSGKKLEEIFFDKFMPEAKYGRYHKASEKQDIEEGTDFDKDNLYYIQDLPLWVGAL